MNKSGKNGKLWKGGLFTGILLVLAAAIVLPWAIRPAPASAQADSDPLIPIVRGKSPATGSAFMWLCDDDLLSDASDDCLATQNNVLTFIQNGFTITGPAVINSDSTDQDSMAYGSGATPVWLVDAGNNRFGILDITPSYTLDVNGTAQVTGNVTIGGNQTLTGTLDANSTGDIQGALNLQSTLTVGGTATVTGPVDANSTSNFQGAITAQSSITTATDITATDDSTGGNAGARSQIQGLFKLAGKSMGAGHDGSAETVAFMDDTPSGEWTALEASAPSVTVSDTTGTYRVGSKGLMVVYGATAAVGDGITANLTDDDWTANESVGGWIYSSKALSSGDLSLGCYNGAAVISADVPAVATANKWTWVEISVAAGNCDMDTVKIVAGTTAIQSATIIYDGWYKWDADDEETLSANLIQDGVLWVHCVATAAGSANTRSDLVEYTNYFTHYQSGNDAIVWIDDESGNSCQALLAYQ